MTMELETELKLDNIVFKVKTLSEMKQEFGPSWMVKVKYTWDKGMDSFAGMIISGSLKLECFKLIIGAVDGVEIRNPIDPRITYLFSRDMIKYKLI